MTKKPRPSRWFRIGSRIPRKGKTLPRGTSSEKGLRHAPEGCALTHLGDRSSRCLQEVVIEDLTEVVSRFRADGTLIFVNQLYCLFFGKEKKELIGRKWLPVAVAEDIPYILAQLKKLSPINPVVTIENRVYGSDGRVNWMQFVNRAFFDRRGEIVEIQSVGRNITDRKRAEIALAQSQARLELVLTATNDGVWDWDLRTGVAYLSPRYWEIIGYSPEDATPDIDFFKRLVHPEDWTEIFSAIQLNIHGVAADCTVECRIYTKNAVLRWLHLRGKVVERGADGVALRMAGTASDITERKELELQLLQSKEYLRSLFDSLPHPVWMKDRQGIYLAANQAVATVAGVASPKEIVGKSDYDIFPNEFANLISVEDKEVLATGTAQTFERDIGLDGRSNWVEIFKTPVKVAGEIVGTVGFSQDINYRRAQQAEDRARKRFLQTKIIERTDQLRRKNEELQGFLYAASHDMAGPLGRISNFGALLENRYREKLDGDALTFLTLIRENTTRLITVLNDLVRHSAIEEISIDQSLISLKSLIDDILQELSQEGILHRAAVRFDIQSPEVVATPGLLREVLTHLIGNALKFSANASQPTLTIGSQEVENRWRIWVKDNGVGFDSCYENRIFEMFRRLHTYQEFPGTGVGLAIVKRAVERMNGEVWAKGSPGQGATFFLVLPKA